jgi:hypothetical protein
MEANPIPTFEKFWKNAKKGIDENAALVYTASVVKSKYSSIAQR